MPSRFPSRGGSVDCRHSCSPLYGNANFVLEESKPPAKEADIFFDQKGCKHELKRRNAAPEECKRRRLSSRSKKQDMVFFGAHDE